MFAVYREIAGGQEEMFVFYDRESALAWLTASDLPNAA
jgi:hypothetical protein